jgi:four helix bundle protein
MIWHCQREHYTVESLECWKVWNVEKMIRWYLLTIDYEMKFTRFEDIEIRQLSMELLKKIYAISNSWDFKSDYGLRDQIRRATISISSNIVEGFERQNNNEFIRFLKIAKWSCGETRNQIYASFYIWYITKENFTELKDLCITISKKTSSLITYLEGVRKQWNFKPTF